MINIYKERTKKLSYCKYRRTRKYRILKKFLADLTVSNQTDRNFASFYFYDFCWNLSYFFGHKGPVEIKINP